METAQKFPSVLGLMVVTNMIEESVYKSAMGWTAEGL